MFEKRLKLILCAFALALGAIVVRLVDLQVVRAGEFRKQAEDAGEHGLAAKFDDIIADETTHRDELRQMLARWP